MNDKKIIFLGGDHASYEVRERLQKHLFQQGFEVFNEGSYDEKPANYAFYALNVAKKVQKNKDSLGIVICGSGLGVNIAANKVKGIKSALVYTKRAAMLAAKNNYNIIALGSRFNTYKNIVNFTNIYLGIQNNNEPNDVSYQYFDIEKK